MKKVIKRQDVQSQVVLLVSGLSKCTLGPPLGPLSPQSRRWARRLVDGPAVSSSVLKSGLVQFFWHLGLGPRPQLVH